MEYNSSKLCRIAALVIQVIKTSDSIITDCG
jgi:hypothetical protein